MNSHAEELDDKCSVLLPHSVSCLGKGTLGCVFSKLRLLSGDSIKCLRFLVQSTLLMRLILTVLNESYTYTELKRDVVDSTFGEDAVIVPCKRIEAYK